MAPTMTWAEFARTYCARQEQTPEGLLKVLQTQYKTFGPDGWVLLECQDMSSSSMGKLCIYPYGPKNSLKEVPAVPLSPTGQASDMSVVIGVLPVAGLPHA